MDARHGSKRSVSATNASPRRSFYRSEAYGDETPERLNNYYTDELGTPGATPGFSETLVDGESEADIDVTDRSLSSIDASRTDSLQRRSTRGSTENILAVRAPRPVQAIPCSPILLVRDKTGQVIDQESDRVSFSYRWYRSKSFRNCANPRCEGPATIAIDPSESGCNTHFQCAQSAKLGIPARFSYFCSMKCFRAAWSTLLAATYAYLVDQGEPECDYEVLRTTVTMCGYMERMRALNARDAVSIDPKEVAYNCVEEMRQAHSIAQLKNETSARQTALAKQIVARLSNDLNPEEVDSSGETWYFVSNQKAYTPTMEDVHKRLRLVIQLDLDGSKFSRDVRTSFVVPMPPFAGRRNFEWTRRAQPLADATMAKLMASKFSKTSSSGEYSLELCKMEPRAIVHFLEQLQPLIIKSKPDSNILSGWSDKFQVQLPAAILPLLNPPPIAKSHPHTIRVLSYNSLADIYATQTVYPYCPLWGMNWSYRWRRLLHEISSLDADIVCLQEAQADHFEHHIQPAMKELGYTGLYKQKTRESLGGPGRIDGCATFFKTSRFVLREKYVIEYNDAAMAVVRAETATANTLPAMSRQAHINAVQRALQRLLRDNVAQISLFDMITDTDGNSIRSESQQSQRHNQSNEKPMQFPVVLANTHLFWDPGYGDVKLWQTQVLMRQLTKYLRQQRTLFMEQQHAQLRNDKRVQRAAPYDVPMILCGDFNSEPDSAVHRFLSHNSGFHLDENGKPLSTLRPCDLPPDPCNLVPSPVNLRHNLPLVSAYAAICGEEPTYTNVTRDYTGCIDYIWYTADAIEPVGVLAMPTMDQLTKYSGTALPNPQWPSDHLPLCADFVPSRAPAGGMTPIQLSHMFKSESAQRLSNVTSTHEKLNMAGVSEMGHSINNTFGTPEMSDHVMNYNGQVMPTAFARAGAEEVDGSEIMMDTDAVAMSSENSRRSTLQNARDALETSQSNADSLPHRSRPDVPPSMARSISAGLSVPMPGVSNAGSSSQAYGHSSSHSMNTMSGIDLSAMNNVHGMGGAQGLSRPLSNTARMGNVPSNSMLNALTHQMQASLGLHQSSSGSHNLSQQSPQRPGMPTRMGPYNYRGGTSNVDNTHGYHAHQGLNEMSGQNARYNIANSYSQSNNSRAYGQSRRQGR